MPLKL
ncbi:50469713-2ff5-42c9-a8da-f0af839fc859 [Thermothielavioides terrestris]